MRPVCCMRARVAELLESALELVLILGYLSLLVLHPSQTGQREASSRGYLSDH